MSDQEDFVNYEEAPELDRICQQIKAEFTGVELITELIIRGRLRYSALHGEAYCVMIRIRGPVGDKAKIKLLRTYSPGDDCSETVRLFVKEFIDELSRL